MALYHDFVLTKHATNSPEERTVLRPVDSLGHCETDRIADVDEDVGVTIDVRNCDRDVQPVVDALVSIQTVEGSSITREKSAVDAPARCQRRIAAVDAVESLERGWTFDGVRRGWSVFADALDSGGIGQGPVDEGVHASSSNSGLFLSDDVVTPLSIDSRLTHSCRGGGAEVFTRKW